MAGSVLYPDSWEFDLMVRLDKYRAAIDANFGSGYTAGHPELVAACIHHDALHDLTEAVRKSASTIQLGLESIANGLP
jgi:hypothetical protein